MSTNPSLFDADETYGRDNGSSLKLVAALWRRKFIVMLAVVAGLAVGYLYFVKQEPIYESVATMMVARTGANPIPGIDNMNGMAWSDRQSDLTTQALLIRSPLVIGIAVNGRVAITEKASTLEDIQQRLDQELGQTKDESVSVDADGNPGPGSDVAIGEWVAAQRSLRSLPSLKGSDDVVSKIIEDLSVNQDKLAKDVMHLSFRGPIRDDCQVVLDAVCESYKAYLKGNRDTRTQEAVSLITRAKDELFRELAKREEEYRAFRSENAHLLFKAAEGANIHQTRMTQIEAARAEALLERSRVAAQLQAIERAREQGGSREALLLLLEKSADSERGHVPTVASLAQKVLPLLLEEQQLKEDFGGDHPKVIAVRKKLELTRQVLSEETGDAGSSDSKRDLLDIYIESLNQELAIFDLRTTELSDRFLEEQQAARNLVALEAQDTALATEIHRKQQLFDVIIKRLEEVSIADDLGGYDATIVSQPAAAVQVEPNLVKIMAIAGLLGMMVGGGLAFAVDTADRRFRSPEDIRRDLGLAVVGHIPKIPMIRHKTASGVSPILCAWHRPKSQAAESYRSVRTSLFFSARSSDLRAIQVTSPNAGDGKSTSCANLAISIAQAGKSVLLVDADFRRPTIHKLFEIERSDGLSSVIKGTTELTDACKATSVPNLSVMTCGRATNNPSELLTSPRFNELLGILRERYDFILIDTPPLLAVTDPSVVAPRVDGVLMVLRMNKRARGAAIRAVEMLSTLGAETLGVVVNGLGKKESYGYSSDYGYGYGSRYSYGNANYVNPYVSEESHEPESEGELVGQPMNGRH